MKTGREQFWLYMVLILALAASAYILGSEITAAWHSTAQHIEEAIK
jgi:Tfp pilus assembly protein PilN